MLKVDHIYKTFNPGTINEKTALKVISLLSSVEMVPENPLY